MMNVLFKKYEEQIRYLFIGGWNTLFGYLVFAGLYVELKHQLHYILIFTLSYVVSITNAYICYKLLVFRTKGNYLREYFRFYLVYASSFIINLGMLPLLVELLKLRLLIAQAILTLLSVFLSYFGHKYFSFGKYRT